MKKVTLFAVIGFGLLCINALLVVIPAFRLAILLDPYLWVWQINSILALIGLVMLEVFFVKLYRRQK